MQNRKRQLRKVPIMNRKIKRNRFTLVELLVSMAVFSILLLVSMQIFSNSQRLWLSSEQKNRTYADARSAMEFITSRIQTQAYSANIPFCIKKNGEMFFPTAMPMNRKKADGEDRDKLSMRFIKFSWSGDDGILRMQIYSDEGNTREFSKNLPPFPGSSAQEAVEKVKDGLTSQEEYNRIDLIENVCKFELIPYKMNEDTNKLEEVSEITEPPYRLDIKLTVTDSKENYENWKNSSDEEKKDLEITFTRTVLLNYRGTR